MKKSDEKAVFRNHLLKLGQGIILSENDSEYWNTLIEKPEEASDIYELFSAHEIRLIQELNVVNFVTFVRILSERTVDTLSDKGFYKDEDKISQLQNCIRFLTKFLPFLFDPVNYKKNELSNIVFWTLSLDASSMANKLLNGGSEDETNVQNEVDTDEQVTSSPLGARLIDALTQALFVPSYTIELKLKPDSNQSKVQGSAGQLSDSSFGSRSRNSPSNHIIDSNRMEIFKLILTLCSETFYEPASALVSTGSKFLTTLVTVTPKARQLSLVCSIFNLICLSGRSSGSENQLVYDEPALTELRYLYVTYALQLLTLMITYPLPSPRNLKFLVDLRLMSATSKPYNIARAYAGKMHKEDELKVLVHYLLNILKSPLITSKEAEGLKFGMAMGRLASNPSLWAMEVSMLLWELCQCNKNVKRLIGKRYASEILIILLYHIHTYCNYENYRNIVRIASYFALYISGDSELTAGLISPIDTRFYDSLPNSFKYAPVPNSARDFIIVQIGSFLISQISLGLSKNIDISNLLLTSLVEILYNVIPLVSGNLENDNNNRVDFDRYVSSGLSYSACSCLTQMISMLSTREFLQERPIGSELLALVLRAICTAIVKHPKPSKYLLHSIMKNERVYQSIWTIIHTFPEEKRQNGQSGTPENNEEHEHPNNDNDNISERISLLSLNESTTEINGRGIANSHYVPQDFFTISPNVTESKSTDEDVDDFDVDMALRPKRPAGMSERAKEKHLMDSPLKRVWGGNSSLRIILTIILPYLKHSVRDLELCNKLKFGDTLQVVKHIENVPLSDLYLSNKQHINYYFFPDTPFEPLKFNWSHLSLGWYMSLLLCNVYNALDSVRNYTGNNNRLMKNLQTSFISFSKFTASFSNLYRQNGRTDIDPVDLSKALLWVNMSLTTVNHWSDTNIKLFKVTNSQNDSLLDILNSRMGKNNNQAVPGTPSGVNDMANILTRKISDFGMRNGSVSSFSSLQSSGSFLDDHDPGIYSHRPRASTTSLHSLNTMNRSRTVTPRNSLSN